MTLSALASTEVSGVVTAVSPTSSVVSNVVTYPVTVDLTDVPSTVKEGMTAQVAVIVQTATNVLELPSAAITTTGSTSTVKVLDASGSADDDASHPRTGREFLYGDRQRAQGGTKGRGADGQCECVVGDVYFKR